MTALSARERRLIAVAILLALVAALWFGAVLPIAGGFAERSARKEDLARVHAVNAAAIARLPQWRGQWARLRRDMADFALDAGSREDAGSLLRGRVASVARRNGAVIKNVQDGPASPGWVRVRLDATVSLEQMAHVLAGIENERPVLIVESLTVSADEAFRTGRPAPVDVRIEITAPYQSLASR